METKKELQKEIDNLMEQPLIQIFVLEALKNINAIVSRMPDDKAETKSETKPEPSLLEVAMYFALHIEGLSIKDCFDRAEKFIAENERRKK